VAAVSPDRDVRFVLITQCIQNDFFLNRDCRLRLPDTIVPQMLLGTSGFDLHRAGNRADEKRADAIASGPFGLFLRDAVGRRVDDETLPPLHVINVRDWHVPGEGYDLERRAYGSHCEAGTWGVAYVDGLDRYLDPTGNSHESDYAEAGSARLYHLRSDSVFDFKPRAEARGEWRKFRASQLEDVLDIVVQGSDEDLLEARRRLREGGFEAIHPLAREIDSGEKPRFSGTVYVAVVGVYTDIKVQTLLVGLRTQYDVPSLAVSDTFTASQTLERHLSGLDYASKVLGVEVVHGINDLVGFLGLPAGIEDETGIVARSSFARYRSFFQDKQNVLAFQDEKLRQYLDLTERRSLDVYERIKRTNTFLIVFGSAFLSVTLVFAVLSAIWPDRFRWEIAAVTGGVGLLQLVSAFVSKPIRDLQQNLTNLAVFKMILESHSLKTALARFHLTTPQALREMQTEEEAKLAAAQVSILQQQVTVIQEFDSADFADLARLALAIGDGGAAAVNGAAPATDEKPAAV
jgi:nicotinamidase-related amidase